MYVQHLIKILLDISKLYTPATSNKNPAFSARDFIFERYTIELTRSCDLSAGLAQPSAILAHSSNGFFFPNKSPTRLLCISLELASSRKSNK